eukprot:scaffold108_cov302-Prasinococcus_capsulatus_cf.AAC.3
MDVEWSSASSSCASSALAFPLALLRVLSLPWAASLVTSASARLLGAFVVCGATAGELSLSPSSSSSEAVMSATAAAGDVDDSRGPPAGALCGAACVPRRVPPPVTRRESFRVGTARWAAAWRLDIERALAAAAEAGCRAQESGSHCELPSDANGASASDSDARKAPGRPPPASSSTCTCSRPPSPPSPLLLPLRATPSRVCVGRGTRRVRSMVHTPEGLSGRRPTVRSTASRRTKDTFTDLTSSASTAPVPCCAATFLLLCARPASTTLPKCTSTLGPSSASAPVHAAAVAAFGAGAAEKAEGLLWRARALILRLGVERVVGLGGRPCRRRALVVAVSP